MFHASRTTLPAILAVLALVSVASGQGADPYPQVLKYRFSEPRDALMAVEAQIRAAKPAELRAIESRLIATLLSPEATTDCKDWVCRQLRQAGSERSVDVLAPLLADKDLATVARLALQSIPGARVDAALRDAVPRLQGDLKAGAILTIGARGDRQAVPLLAPLAADRDPALAEAALYALGRIGDAPALRALEAATVSERLKRFRCHAILLCAERMAAEGQAVQAVTVYRTLYEQSGDAITKTGALRGIVLADKANAASLLAAAMNGNDARLRSAAAKFACELGGADLLRPLLANLATLPTDVQVTILGMVRDRFALPAVLAAASRKDEGIRLAALAALGRIGDASTVPLLLQAAAGEQGDLQAAARSSLREIRGEEADAALIAAVRAGKSPAGGEAMRALADRGAASAVPVLLDAARQTDRWLAAEALGALGVLADMSAIPALVKLLAESDEGRRRAVENGLAAACRRIANKDAAAACIAAALPGATADVRCALLRVLARVPSARSLAALRAAAADSDAAVKDAAIRGLAEWPDSAAMADLLAIARTAPSQVHKVLALRGVIRLAGQPNVRPAEQTVRLLTEAMGLARRAEERRMVLGALAEVQHPAALEVAATCLTDKELEVEAATAVVRIAKFVQRTNPDAAAAAVQRILKTAKSPAARQVAESAQLVLNNMVNIAPQGTASSPDGLDKDGGSGGDQAAIDGDPSTYWDEQDNQKLYRFVVTFKQPEKIAAISVTGYAHHNYAPKDFQVLCDGKVVKGVENAQYDNNFLVLRLDPTECKSVELRISGYYGRSPAIRELGIYRSASAR